MPEFVADIWDEFYAWLRKINFANPKDVDEILPQYFASHVMKNIRLASIFSIDVTLLRNNQYEGRLHLWAANIVHCFGKAASMAQYMAWVNNVSIDEELDSETRPSEVISFRIFLNDLHLMVSFWKKLGKAFLSDLFWWVWFKIEREVEHKWTAEQAKTNSAPFQIWYTHEVNHANKVEHREKGEAYTWIPGDDKYFNILSKGYAIVLANKSKRGTIKREYVSYVYNPDWWTITINEQTSVSDWIPFELESAPKASTGSTPLRDPLLSSNDKIRKKGGGVSESSVDWKRITPTVTAKQTGSGESRPTPTTPILPDKMDLDELGNDKVKPIQFPSLLGEDNRNMASRMLEDPEFF